MSQVMHFCGKPVSEDDLSLIIEVCESFQNLSRTEIAATICELLQWYRPNGKPKTIECYQFLRILEEYHRIELPLSRPGRPLGPETFIHGSRHPRPEPPIRQPLSVVRPVQLVLIADACKRQRWKEFVAQYHDLGFKTPFGARLRYFVEGYGGKGTLGCLQFSSPAWRLQARDDWIGWTDGQRKSRLQWIVQNSRFLIFPWIEIKNLASHVLSLASKQVPCDWQRLYGLRPVLLETFVDKARFKGTCYQAANWVLLGQTRGRGRMDRQNEYGSSIKDIWVKPLRKNWRRHLLGLLGERHVSGPHSRRN